MIENRIPVTVLTGFLGAGKTTLMNRILTENHGLRLAVIENEFGEIGIDHELVVNSDEEIFEMNNGCVCCTVRGDLIRILGNLARRRERFDHVLIETTGLADPGPVIQTFFLDEETREKFVVNGVVTLVDCRHVLLHMESSPEVKEQIAFADVILLNKADLAAGEEIGRLETRVRSINALARIHRCEHAGIDVATLLDIGGFSPGRATELDPRFFEEEETPGHEHHHHDDEVGSVGIEAPGFCDGGRLNEWISTLLREQGGDIYRMKGVFAVRGAACRVILQAVHMTLDVAEGGPWGREREPGNSVVFIGRNLDRAALVAGFKACLID